MARHLAPNLPAELAAPHLAEELDALAPGLSGHRRALLRLWHSPRAVVGLLIVFFLLALAAFGPLVAPHDPNYQFDNGLDDNGNPIAHSAQFL